MHCKQKSQVWYTQFQEENRESATTYVVFLLFSSPLIFVDNSHRATVFSLVIHFSGVIPSFIPYDSYLSEYLMSEKL